jgi:threonine/homoserine/homoserine lactone efflux protein
MPIILLIKGILIGLMVSVPVGPVGVMCIQRTMNRGLKAGVVSGLGAASADTFYAVISSCGIGFIFTFIQKQIFWIQFLGAIILILIAIKIFYTNPAVEIRNSKNKKVKPMEEFISIFFITLSNPTVFFVFIALLASLKVFSGKINYLSGLFVISGVFAGAMLWWYLLSSIVNKFRNKIKLKQIWWLNKIMAVVVFIFGMIVLVNVVLST